VIVDTSALMCLALKEPGWERILTALMDERASIPAPALVEFRRVIWRRDQGARKAGERLLDELFTGGLEVEGFGAADAELAKAANELWGIGNGRGGALNLLDLMVYSVAQRLGRPILCTGKDFAATDAAIHPASRGW
jgi:ribonuclease VapC